MRRIYSASGGSGQPVIAKRDLSDQINNARQSFSLPPYRKGTLLVFLNGLAQSTSEITETSRTTFATSFIPRTGSNLSVFFQPL